MKLRKYGEADEKTSRMKCFNDEAFYILTKFRQKGFTGHMFSAGRGRYTEKKRSK